MKCRAVRVSCSKDKHRKRGMGLFQNKTEKAQNK